MNRFLALVLIALSFVVSSLPVMAEEVKPDDTVAINLSAEDWVTTKTARVNLAVEAAVTSQSAGTMRAAMTKAVGDMVKAEWRVTSFNRSQDSTGMERWSALYEARVPENEIGSLNDKAKQSSKAGMQITVSSVDFTPTLEETQSAYGTLRSQIYKMANEQLTSLNTAIAGRNYRIATIEFMGEEPQNAMPAMTYARGKAMMNQMRAAAPEIAASDSAAPMERSDKLNLSARVVFAATPPASTPTK